MGSLRWRARSWLLRCFGLLALPLLLGLLACDAASPEPAARAEIDEISYELFPTTRLLSAAALSSIQLLDEDGSITLQPAPASLDDLTPGMVLVGGASPRTPEGLLRGVGSVLRDGDRLTLRTMVVPVQFAFRRLQLRSAHRIPSLASARQQDLGDLSLQSLKIQGVDGVETKNVRWVLFDGDGDEQTLDDQVRLEGELGGGFSFDTSFEVNWGAVENLPQAVLDCLKSIPGILIGQLPDCTPLALLPEAKATFEVGPDLRARADLIGSASLEFQKELAIVKMSLTPIPIGPIVLVPGVDVLATLSGSAGARFRTGFDAELSARMALVASTKSGVSVTPPKLERSEVNGRPTELAIMAKGRVSLGARISMSVYGIIGPYAQVDGFAELAADTSKDPCWEIAAGLSARAGLLLTTPRLPVLGYVTLFDLETPTWDIFRSGALASGACTLGKGAALPGAGPSEETYGKPSFPTWSSVRSAPGDLLFPITATLDPSLSFCMMERTTDGRFLALGAGSERLLKLDEQGQEVWSRGVRGPSGPLPLGRLATLPDTSLVIGSSVDGEPAILRLNQQGAPFPASVFSLEGCAPGPVAAVHGLPAPGPSSLVFTGVCLDQPASYLLKTSASGQILEARLLSVPTPDRLIARALSVVDGSLWWLGTYTQGGIDQVAAVRLSADLEPLASSAYVGSCENNRRIEPASARPAMQRSELLIVGSSGGGHEGLLLRLRSDASVAVGSFPSFGPGASEVAVLQSIVELPTTGYVVAGSHRDVLAPTSSPPATLAPFVAWLDAAGSVLSARRFVLDDGSVPASSPRIELTDDGGLMFAAARPAPVGHELWTMKSFARDGTVNDARVQPVPFPFQAAACGVEQRPLPVTLQPLPARSRVAVVSPL